LVFTPITYPQMRTWCHCGILPISSPSAGVDDSRWVFPV